ncbi:serine hydrolase domain-containing protein [Pandoraea commovens]|uniref:Beta-lactamase family protein n=1 Tax=Pandoraea commovens TaxID=2508289 RepID=A0ABY5QJW8_9BURK|nr:serine hydrolase domain-containing protein [Pandoraea commovens]UVA80894.1 beta-lactamase family protein [Pandoraea commovens]
MSAPVPFDDDALIALFDPFNRSDAPGVVVGAAIDGKVVLRRAFGMANVGPGIALDARTRLRIGSTTKHMACLAALLLQEAGALDIDAPIRRYLPELTGVAGEPTLRSLMHHTSGQRCALDISLLTNGLAVPQAGYLLDIQRRQLHVNFPAGERMMYCNGGYHLVSLAIERVSGQSFASFLTSEIFEPLGMSDTFCMSDDFQIRNRMAACHVKRSDGAYERGLFPSREILGEGCVVSCVDDMLQWCAHLRGEKTVGSRATWDAMFSSPTFSSGMRSDYMMGLKRTHYRGCELIHHAGGVVGGTCQMLCVPAHGVDIVLLSNGAIPAPASLSLRMLDILLADRMQAYPMPTPAPTPPSSAYTGTYRDANGDVVYDVVGRDGGMTLSGPLEPGIPTLYERDAPEGGTREFASESSGDGTFRLQWGTDIDPDDTGHLRIVHCGHPANFRRTVPLASPDEETIDSLSGDYFSEEADARASLRPLGQAQPQGDGRPVMSLVMAGNAGECCYDVFQVESDLFRFSPDGPGAMLTGTLAIVRHPDTGLVEGISVNTTRTRNLRFAKS